MRFRYRLDGEIDGRAFGFDLEDGDHRVGSSHESDVRLPLEGVSRRHALLRVLPGGVSVEDSGSRNGTFIDGNRVQKAAAHEGAVLAFGPVELTLRTIEGGEAVAAILLESPPLPGSSLAPEMETPLLSKISRGPEGNFLVHIEAVLELLRGPSGRTGALAATVEACGATGAWLAHWPAAGEPAVWVAHGEPPALPGRRQIDAALSGRRRGSLRWQSGADPFEMVSLAELDGGVTGLIVGTSRGPAPEESFLRICLRILRGASPLPGDDTEEPRRASKGRRRLIFPPDHLPGTDPRMEALYAELEMALGTDLPILFLGETGVGKDRLVKVFHASSTRAAHPLVALNCAAISADLFESELFGTVRGAATGVEARLGALRQAGQGTLFLDEVGEMPAQHQAKLLRVLQEREVQPVGSDRVYPVDIRVVAATNQNLEQQVSDGAFRRDLFYRLSGHVVTLLPLRHRRGDLPGLIELFARRAVETHGASVLGFSSAALRCLLRYSWPGNIRELETEIQRLVAACAAFGGRRLIDVKMLPERILDSGPPGEGEADWREDVTTGADLDLPSQVDSLERRLIREALERSGGKRSEAARLLGIHRNGLRLKMKRLGLDTGAPPEGPSGDHSQGDH